MQDVTLIAFYLPQYHPIPENDEWWGKGFTEWTNTAKALPRFKGHYQPHIPADLGFYDLRVSETRAQQAELARRYGIDAFCYYNYWFAGRRLLERPLMEVVQTGAPDFPFCICWANESWTGVWHGRPNETLIEQTYPGESDHRNHFAALLSAFRDRRYFRVQGKPMFLIYAARALPDTHATLTLWRRMAENAGLGGLYIVAVTWDLEWSPYDLGFDARVLQRLPPKRHWFPWREPIKKVSRYLERLRGIPTIHSYAQTIGSILPPALPDKHTFPCVLPNWDNTPRSGENGLVLADSTPSLFRAHLRDAIRLTRDAKTEPAVVFVKSWNEWAEGNHLEPDLRFGHGYLEAITDALKETNTHASEVPRFLGSFGI